ncbi:hypothetical protein GPECTOR_68g363 [Gonium pectorale]|uniref:Dienelactone hydrolase domain-containing protein n=1 Tax=Gonium pectorale TaxID=33097 RepID=A0A150G3D6_GONPE|nr:hypothetical protein GPECTOR_68g363 [Gonium pectorale]|eukprot:KXZ44392.1 hypothetical protein GPECTOR_68g363 [Gonium pectorale]
MLSVAHRAAPRLMAAVALSLLVIFAMTTAEPAKRTIYKTKNGTRSRVTDGVTDGGTGGVTDAVGEFKKIFIPSSSGSAPAPAYEAGPKDRPAVLVVQIAEQGYRVLVPDLYRGDVALEVTQALRLEQQLNWTQGIRDVAHAVQYLKRTGSPKVGIVGFCMGGTMAFCGGQYADVDAVVVLYGLVGDHIPCDPLKIPKDVPVQLQFGDDDGITPVSAIEPVAAEMRRAGISTQLYTYPGLPHAYFNALTSEGRQLRIVLGQDFRTANETLVALSFARMASFLRQHIGS